MMMERSRCREKEPTENHTKLVVTPQTCQQIMSEYQLDCPFVWYQNIRSASFSFVTVDACDRQTHAQTDREID